VKNDTVRFVREGRIHLSWLPLSDVDFYKYNYLLQNLRTSDAAEKYSRLRVAVNSGIGYLTAKNEKIPPQLNNYFRRLKLGGHLAGDIAWYFVDFVGVGAKFDWFASSNNENDAKLTDKNGNTAHGKLRNDIYITFFGPMISLRLLDEKNRNALMFNISGGYIYYVNDEVFFAANNTNSTTTGHSFGYMIDVGYDIKLTNHFLLGFQVSLLSGTLRKFVFDDGEEKETITLDKKENGLGMGRMNLSAGLRYCF
jgi:hypothetical protein